MERTAFLDKMLDRYAAWYDIARVDEGELPLVATAVYHEHNTGFLLIRKAEAWTADRHEYAYIYSLPRLTDEAYEACYAQAMELGQKLVDPVKGHMCSAISVIFLCDHVDDDARQKLIRCRFRKSFQFSLRGWMEARTCAVDLEESTVCANQAAREIENFMNNLLHPKKRKRNFIQSLLNRE